MRERSLNWNSTPRRTPHGKACCSPRQPPFPGARPEGKAHRRDRAAAGLAGARLRDHARYRARGESRRRRALPSFPRQSRADPVGGAAPARRFPRGAAEPPPAGRTGHGREESRASAGKRVRLSFPDGTARMLALRRPGAASARAQYDERALHGTGALDFRDLGLSARRAAARTRCDCRRARDGRRPDARRKFQHCNVRPFFPRRLRRGGQGAPSIAGRRSCARRGTRAEKRRKAREGKEMTLISFRRLMTIMAAALMAACAVGPDYHAPVAPAVGIYTERPQPERTEAAPVRGGEAQRFEVGAKISADWWTLFGSLELDGLMRTALSGHPTLAAAQAALRQAEENLNAQYAVLYPSVDAGLLARRQRISGASIGNPAVPGTTFNLYNASVNVSYAIDVAGGARRELEALQAGIEFQRFQLEATYLSLTGNIATTAFREASLREQIRATRDIVDSQDRQLQLVEKQFALGALSRADVLAQRAQLAQTRANLPPLEKALAQTRNQLAVLIGKFPDEVRLPDLDLAAFRLPQNLPVSLPSDLVRQRPDIRSAETLLHQTNARIGVAQALMFPQLTLNGSFGTAATRGVQLFGDPGTQIWYIGASLLQPTFHAGQLQASKRGAQAD